MKRQCIIFLILIFVLGLVPVNFSQAITQNQINAEVQIVCPDSYGNWFSGSGTIIDPKGIILTNKHVVTDEKGGIIKACFVGFVETINSEPNFGTESNPNIAEVKYFTTTEDMDTAILYLDNKTNKVYPYINIWGSDSSSLKFGDKLEVIGFPGIGGSTITYTSGDFSGFGSNGDGTQNYIKTTAPLEHGNSGGASYNPSANFIGIPTMVVAGTLNSLSYILSINSIKNWLSGILGSNYQQEAIEQKPNIEKPTINLQDDKTPPKIENAPRTVFSYVPYNENGQKADGLYYGNLIYNFKDLYSINSFRKVKITMVENQYAWSMDNMDQSSGLYSVYYSYSDRLDDLLNSVGTEHVISNLQENNSIKELTPVITFPDAEKTYYISIRFKDKAGNISSPHILTYVYEQNNFLKLKNIKFYSDSAYKNMIGNYDFTMESTGWVYPQYFQYCATKYKDVYVKWQYENNNQQYAVNHYDHFIGEMSASESQAKGDITTTNLNKYKVSNLNLGGQKTASYEDTTAKTNLYYGQSLCYNGNCDISGAITSFVLKPQTYGIKPAFEGINRTVLFAYNPNLPFDFLCGGEDKSLGRNQWGQAYYSLKQGKSLIEDSLLFDSAQQKIADSSSSPQEQNIPKSAIDIGFAKKQIGKILLQVQLKGEAWYVNPKDNKRYYMANGNEAFKIMRNFGVGITNSNLNRIKNDKYFAKKFSGKIFLQVEVKGEAYYIDFNGIAHYLKDGTAAYGVMRSLGLGITNNDLSKITEGNL
ncbi:MAG: S1C family serine protease [Patescibacteria group bacterium]|jgi:S1-C subfamily serine protease